MRTIIKYLVAIVAFISWMMLGVIVYSGVIKQLRLNHINSSADDIIAAIISVFVMCVMGVLHHRLYEARMLLHKINERYCITQSMSGDDGSGPWSNFWLLRAQINGAVHEAQHSPLANILYGKDYELNL
jgi:hypothetical protein